MAKDFGILMTVSQKPTMIFQQSFVSGHNQLTNVGITKDRDLVATCLVVPNWTCMIGWLGLLWVAEYIRAFPACLGKLVSTKSMENMWLLKYQYAIIFVIIGLF